MPVQRVSPAPRLLKLQNSTFTSSSLMFLHIALVVSLMVQMPAVVGSNSILSSSAEQLQQSQDTEFSQVQAVVGLAKKEDTQMSSAQESHGLVRVKRQANNPTFWPGGIIPFVFIEPFPRRYKRQVMKAIGVWERNTCVRFVDRTNHSYFAKLEVNNFTCDSLVGIKQYPHYRDSGQPVKLTKTCLRKRGYIIHELGHLVGFYHEHQRPDRDDYIHLNLTNLIHPALDELFVKLEFQTYGPYDFHSVMHYPLNFSAQVNKTTMQVLPNVTAPAGVDIGRRHSVSFLDTTKARKMYNCPKKRNKSKVPKIERLSGDNIYSGEQVSLMVNGSSFPANSWLSCTQQSCTFNNCPGKHLRENDIASCPYNIFTLHKLNSHDGAPPSSAVIRVGDSIVLEHRIVLPTAPAIQQNSLFVSCNPQNLVCSLSVECTVNFDSFSITSDCQENVLQVKAKGKVEGDAITHRDLIGLEYKFNHGTGVNERQCAFGCDPLTTICAKEVCTYSNSLSNDPLVCGKDMFVIKKF